MKMKPRFLSGTANKPGPKARDGFPGGVHGPLDTPSTSRLPKREGFRLFKPGGGQTAEATRLQTAAQALAKAAKGRAGRMDDEARRRVGIRAMFDDSGAIKE